jgi:hypothetical protein
VLEGIEEAGVEMSRHVLSGGHGQGLSRAVVGWWGTEYAATTRCVPGLHKPVGKHGIRAVAGPVSCET